MGTVSAWVPGAYVATGIGSSGVFIYMSISGYSERFSDRYLTLAQVCVSTLILLLFFAYVPSMGFMFLGTLFIVSGFGSLRLSLRDSALMALVMVSGTGVIFYFSPSESYFLEATSGHIVIAWLWFVATLIRLSALGMIGKSLRETILRRQKALAESEQLFKQAAQIARLGHYVWDAFEDQCLHVSKEYARILGLTVDEVFRQYSNRDKDILLVHPDDRERVLANYAKWHNHAGSYDYEYRIITPDGEERHVRETGDPVVNSQGQRVRTVGILQDITAKKKAQEVLEESEQKYRALFELSQDAVMTMNREGYIDCNQATLDMFGIGSKEEFLNLPTGSLPPDPARWKRLPDFRFCED